MCGLYFCMDTDAGQWMLEWWGHWVVEIWFMRSKNDENLIERWKQNAGVQTLALFPCQEHCVLWLFYLLTYQKHRTCFWLVAITSLSCANAKPPGLKRGRPFEKMRIRQVQFLEHISRRDELEELSFCWEYLTKEAEDDRLYAQHLCTCGSPK